MDESPVGGTQDRIRNDRSPKKSWRALRRSCQAAISSARQLQSLCEGHVPQISPHSDRAHSGHILFSTRRRRREMAISRQTEIPAAASTRCSRSARGTSSRTYDRNACQVSSAGSVAIRSIQTNSPGGLIALSLGPPGQGRGLVTDSRAKPRTSARPTRAARATSRIPPQPWAASAKQNNCSATGSTSTARLPECPKHNPGTEVRSARPKECLLMRPTERTAVNEIRNLTSRAQNDNSERIRSPASSPRDRAGSSPSVSVSQVRW